MRMLDICCGTGGWSDAFAAEGFDVLGVDIEKHPDYRHRILVGDVRELKGLELGHFDVVCASPPCVGFSYANAQRSTGQRPSASDLRLVLEAIRIIEEVAPRFWLIENVLGARPFFEPILGQPHPYSQLPIYLWGHMPLALGLVDRPRKLKGGGEPWRKLYKSHHSAEAKKKRHIAQVRRARIPAELAGPLARACRQVLLVEATG